MDHVCNHPALARKALDQPRAQRARHLTARSANADGQPDQRAVEPRKIARFAQHRAPEQLRAWLAVDEGDHLAAAGNQRIGNDARMAARANDQIVRPAHRSIASSIA